MSSQNNVSYMGELDFHDYYQIIYRGRWIILFCFLAVVLATAVYTFTSKFIYQSTASVSIDTRDTRSSLSRLRTIGSTQDYQVYDPDRIVKNEVELLKSRFLAFGLAKELLKREYIDTVSKEPIRIIHQNQDGSGPLLDVDIVTARLLGDITITPSREADFIDIIARSSSPDEAALLANMFVDVYYNGNVSSSRLRLSNIREFLEGQVKTKQGELTGSEVALKNYMERERIVSLDDESKKIIDILARFQAARDEAMIETEAVGKQLVSYQDELEKVEPQTAKNIASAGDKYIEQLQTEIARLEVNRDVIIAQNPLVASQQIYNQQLQETEKQIGSLRTKLREKTDELMKTSIPDQPTGGQSGAFGYIRVLKERIIDNQIKKQAYNSRIKILTEIIRQYEGQFNRLPDRSMRFAQLQRNKTTDEKVYLMVTEKYQEAFIAEQSEFGNVNILDRAKPSFQPVSPKVFVNLALAILGGLVLGLGVVILRELIDSRVRSPEDVKKQGLVTLALVHNFDTIQEVKENIMGGNGTSARSGDFSSGMNLKKSLVVYYNPMSPVAESFRRLRTSLFFASPDKPLKSILVTSAEPSEGKTTITANLALTYAQLGKKTLIVDGDLRRGSLHKFFDREKSPGLTEYLTEESRLDSVIGQASIDNLSIVGCGLHSPNPAELLSTPMMHTFRKSVEKAYDFVIYDSSPLLLVTDSLVLASIVDGVILVVQSGETRTAVLAKSIEMLQQVGANIVGVVVNRFDYRSTLHSYYKSYTYYTYEAPGDENGKTRQGRKRKEVKRT
jgi:capsular exopolysaccharide synthesis family protein